MGIRSDLWPCCAGETTTGILRFAVPPRQIDRPDRLKLNLFYNSDAEALQSYDFAVNYQAKPRPHFSYSWLLVESGEADGQLDVDEEAELQITVMNDGDGDAIESVLYLFKDNDQHVQLGEGRVRIPAIPAGEQKVVYSISVRSVVKSGQRSIKFRGEEIVLQLRLEERFEQGIDNRFRASLFHTLTIPLSKPVVGAVLQQPKVSILSHEQVSADSLQLTVQVEDDNAQYIAIFRGDDKVLLRSADQLDDNGQLHCQVSLVDGLNDLKFIVHDSDDITDVASYIIGVTT